MGVFDFVVAVVIGVLIVARRDVPASHVNTRNFLILGILIAMIIFEGWLGLWIAIAPLLMLAIAFWAAYYPEHA